MLQPKTFKCQTHAFLQWHALTREEQAKYYELARKERQLHMQLYPTWSARDNYVRIPPPFRSSCITIIRYGDGVFVFIRP